MLTCMQIWSSFPIKQTKIKIDLNVLIFLKFGVSIFETRKSCHFERRHLDMNNTIVQFLCQILLRQLCTRIEIMKCTFPCCVYAFCFVFIKLRFFRSNTIDSRIIRFKRYRHATLFHFRIKNISANDVKNISTTFLPSKPVFKKPESKTRCNQQMIVPKTFESVFRKTTYLFVSLQASKHRKTRVPRTLENGVTSIEAFLPLPLPLFLTANRCWGHL